MRRRQSGRPLDRAEQPFTQLARAVAAVPIERRRERRIVTVGLWRLLLSELRLRAHFWPHEQCLVRMRVAPSDFADLAGAASGGGPPDQVRRLLSPGFRHLARDLSRGGAIAVVCQVVGQKISFPSISLKHSAAVSPR